MPISLAQCRSCENTFSNKLKKGGDYWSVMFLVFGLVAGVLGLTGLAGAAMHIAWILFVVFIVLFFVSFVMGRRPPP